MLIQKDLKNRNLLQEKSLKLEKIIKNKNKKPKVRNPKVVEKEEKKHEREDSKG